MKREESVTTGRKNTTKKKKKRKGRKRRKKEEQVPVWCGPPKSLIALRGLFPLSMRGGKEDLRL
jgi:hypothetical protein